MFCEKYSIFGKSMLYFIMQKQNKMEVIIYRGILLYFKLLKKIYKEEICPA